MNRLWPTVRLTPVLQGFMALWFMLLTCYGVVHNAEHTFHKHYHYGHECPIFEFCEQQQLGDGLPSVPLVFLLAEVFPPAVDLVRAVVHIRPVVAAPARAPPALS